LIGRKTARDGGTVARSVIGEITGLASAMSADANGALVPIGNELQSAATALKSAVDWVVPAYGKASRAAHAASVPYLRLWGLVAGGWQLARGAQIAARLLAENKGDPTFYRGKIATARFYAECLLPQAAALARAITLGSESVLAMSDEQF
jgi:3-(methylthio)propanoyl-CoA dehydrogenase